MNVYHLFCRSLLLALPSGTTYLNICLILNFPQTIILGVSWKHFCLHSTEDDILAH